MTSREPAYERKPRYTAEVTPAGRLDVAIDRPNSMHELRISRGSSGDLFVMDVAELAGVRDAINAYLKGLPDA